MGFLAAIPAAFSAIAAGSATAAQTAIALTTAATAVSAAGAGYQAYSQHQQMAYQAQVSANNAAIADRNKDSALAQGSTAESMSREQTTRSVGAALAGQGADGLDVGYGTTAGVREGIQNVGDIDALTIRYNAAQRALGYATQGMDYQAQSAGDKIGARNALTAGAFNVGSTFVSGASSIANQQMLYNLFATQPSGPK